MYIANLILAINVELCVLFHASHIFIHLARSFQLAQLDLSKQLTYINCTLFQGDLQVRLKILVLIDSWQEAFGGPIGKHIHYYLAYNELRVSFPKLPLPCYVLSFGIGLIKSFGGPFKNHIPLHVILTGDCVQRYGVRFPQRSFPTPPIITPPVTQHSTTSPQLMLGSIQSSSLKRLDKAILSHDGNSLQ